VPYVFGELGIDRHYYALCAVSELRNTLRAGDVWVSGSRQFKDFEDYLIPAAAFDALAKRQVLPVAVPANFEAFCNERFARLDRELEYVANLAEHQQLPDAEIREGALEPQQKGEALGAGRSFFDVRFRSKKYAGHIFRAESEALAERRGSRPGRARAARNETG
jgi:hypothetical protein